MKTTTSTIRHRTVGVAVIATFALASCGGDDDTASTDPESTEAPTDPSSTEPGGSDETTVEPTDPATSDPVTSDPVTTEPVTTDPGSSGDALSAEEWRSQFDALCDAARDSGDAVEEPRTVGDFDESVDSIIDIGDTLFEDAAELTPPAELEEGASNLASLWDDQRAKLEDLKERIKAGYDDDQVLADIPQAEGEELVGDALDQSGLSEQADELGVSCFNAGE
ncbi:MAG: hypothetical protein H0V69_03380 [Acidimicrobiia bacterium]|nr:hypothetical protein [Acidimicrobiia bacterium]